jgi:hypothetical protein
MAHSVELIFDTAGEAAIQRIWRILAAAGLPSQVRVKSDTNRPHVTLVAARHICADVDAALRALGPVLPLDCVIGAPVVFPGPRQTLTRLIVPSAGLLALHERVFGLCLPHIAGEPFGHCRPGHWTAHATLGRRFTAAQIGAALALDDDGLHTEFPAQLVGLRRWDGDNRVDHLLVSRAD